MNAHLNIYQHDLEHEPYPDNILYIFGLRESGMLPRCHPALVAFDAVGSTQLRCCVTTYKNASPIYHYRYYFNAPNVTVLIYFNGWQPLYDLFFNNQVGDPKDLPGNPENQKMYSFLILERERFASAFVAFRELHSSLPVLIAVNKRSKSTNLSNDEVLDFLDVQQRQNVSVVDVDLDAEKNVIQWASSLFPKSTSFKNEAEVKLPADLSHICVFLATPARQESSYSPFDVDCEMVHVDNLAYFARAQDSALPLSEPHKFVKIARRRTYGSEKEIIDNSFVDLDLNRLYKEFDEYDRYKKASIM
ncbi:9449_t:CDS:2 [Ambispora leptoticha]|uniref:9449_t:CDS:1 n=1 Tax=Ambispora leptoticha TaxID=144679 RepID=A0A9N8VWN0_9GLOM|nr:9449_t:CDS:2 [Ambispora leptoticha]